MRNNTLSLLSGRVKKTPSTSADSNRYSYLDLKNAEPDAGVPSAHSSQRGLFGSDTSGNRQWFYADAGLSVDISTGQITVNEDTVFIDTSGFTNSTSDNLADVLFDLDQNLAELGDNTLSTVATDDTIAGAGTVGSPLSVGQQLFFTGKPEFAGLAIQPDISVVSGISLADPIVITTTGSHNLTDGELVTIEDVQGTVELNGNNYYVDVLTTSTFALYSDHALTTSVDGTSGFTAYTSSGKILHGGYRFPEADGTDGTYLKTNGYGLLEFDRPIQYGGSQPADPDLGDMWYDSVTTGDLLIWDGTNFSSATGGGSQGAFSLVQFQGDGSTTAFDTNNPSVNKVLVFLNGILMRLTDDFTYSAGVVTFTQAPLNGDTIEVLLTGNAGLVGLDLLGIDNHDLITVDTSGNVTLTGDLDMGTNNIINMADPVNAQDAATKAYVDAQIGGASLETAGDTGTGTIDLDSQSLTISGTANEIETTASGQNVTIGLPTSITVDVTGDLTGNADTSTALATSRDFSLTGAVTASAVGFDGTGNVALSTSITNLPNSSLANSSIDITDGTTTETISLGDTITFADGTDIDVVVSATGTLTVNHNVTGANSTITAATNTFVDEITVTAQGHVTSVGSSAIDFNVADNYAYQSFTDGTNTTTADSNADTLTVTPGDQIEATISTDTLTLGHADSGVTAASYGSSTAIPVLTIDAQGHVTSASTSSISTTWTISDGATTQDISGGDTLTVVDGTDINAVISATDTLTINNTSTLDSVTTRGNVTSNDITVNDITANDINSATLTTTGNVTVGGDLTVNGTTTTLNTQTITAEDAVILLNSGQATPANDIGLIFQRYSSPTASNYNVAFIWEETTDRLIFASTTEAGADADISLANQWATINATGVGVGTTSPQTQLHIADDVGGNSILVTGSVGNEVARLETVNGFTNRAQLLLKEGTGGADKVKFTSQENTPNFILENNVGIGTTDPQELLEVKNNASTARVRITSADANDATLDFAEGSTVRWRIGNSATNDDFFIRDQDDGTEVVRVQTGSSGNSLRINSTGVGIGTNSPSHAFHVYGNDAVNPIVSKIQNGGASQARLDIQNSEGNFSLISDGGTFSIYDNTDTTQRFDINTLGAITFNDAFTFPNADGATGQVLVTDGAGTLTWGDIEDSIDFNVADNYAFKTISVNTQSDVVADSNADTLTLIESGIVTITTNATNDSITIDATETDTLDTVTTRGNTTNNDIYTGTVITDLIQGRSTNVQTNRLDLFYDSTNNGVNAVNLESVSGMQMMFDTNNNDSNGFMIGSGTNDPDTAVIHLTIDSGGKVGIGTTTPGFKLDVIDSGLTTLLVGSTGGSGSRLFLDGNANGDGSGGDYAKLTHDGTSGDLEITNLDSGNIRFKTNSETERVVIQDNGNVGIGVTNPDWELDIQGISPVLKIADNRTNNVGSAAAIWMGENASSLTRGAGIIYNGAANTLNLVTSNNATVITTPYDAVYRLSIKESNGYVGIGSTDPNHMLEVHSTNSTPFSFDGTSAGGTVYGQIVNRSASAVGNGAGLELRANSSTQERQLLFIESEWIDNTDATRHNLTRFYQNDTGNNEMVMALRGHNIGIGTSTPERRLTVYEDSAIVHTLLITNSGNGLLRLMDANTTNESQAPAIGTYGDDLALITNGTNRIYIESTGNVGIATDTPQSMLMLGNNATPDTTAYLTFGKRTASTETNAPFIGQDSKDATTNDLGLGARSTSGSINFYTGNAAAFSSSELRMILTSGGNLGIGTSTPSTRLHIQQAANTVNDGIQVRNAGNSSGMFLWVDGTDGQIDMGTLGDFQIQTGSTKRVTVLQTGNVGIGTTEPESQLQVHDDTQSIF